LKKIIKLVVNGDEKELYVNVQNTLLEVLRDKLNLTGVKYGCGTGECGACTVLINGEPDLACLSLAVEADGKRIETIEGVADRGNLHPIQDAFLDAAAIQCGFCTPGMVMQAKALINENPNPDEDQVKDYIKGNLCRCGNYPNIVKAILDAAEKMKS
jgi:aerobic-type carbon monoxide dehydrogenase small subunit (CoxS/CutS family)